MLYSNHFYLITGDEIDQLAFDMLHFVTNTNINPWKVLSVRRAGVPENWKNILWIIQNQEISWTDACLEIHYLLSQLSNFPHMLYILCGNC